MNHDLDSALKSTGLRITTPREALFDVLKNAQRPLTATEIIKAAPHLDKVGVYRTIDLFLKLTIIVIVPQGWKPHYELASPFKPHHHHLYCNNCAKLIDIHESRVEEAIASVAKQYHFQVQSHTFEISGLCKDCQATHQAS